MSRLLRPVALIAGACALLALSATAFGAKPKGRADTATAWAAITHVVKGIEIADGDYADKILGHGVVEYRLKVIPAGSTGTFKVTSKPVVLYTATGSLSGSATATVVIVGTKETISKGKLSLTKGTGSLKGHSFTGTFTGTGDLVANQLVFHDKGIYR